MSPASPPRPRCRGTPPAVSRLCVVLSPPRSVRRRRDPVRPRCHADSGSTARAPRRPSPSTAIRGPLRRPNRLPPPRGARGARSWSRPRRRWCRGAPPDPRRPPPRRLGSRPVRFRRRAPRDLERRTSTRQWSMVMRPGGLLVDTERENGAVTNLSPFGRFFRGIVPAVGLLARVDRIRVPPLQVASVLVPARETSSACSPRNTRGRSPKVSARFVDAHRPRARHTPQTRQMLRKLLNGSMVRCAPLAAERGYRIEGTGTYARLPGVAGAGSYGQYTVGWCPRRATPIAHFLGSNRPVPGDREQSRRPLGRTRQTVRRWIPSDRSLALGCHPQG